MFGQYARRNECIAHIVRHAPTLPLVPCTLPWAEESTTPPDDVEGAAFARFFDDGDSRRAGAIRLLTCKEGAMR